MLPVNSLVASYAPYPLANVEVARIRIRIISLTKGWAKDIISPLGCISPVEGRFVSMWGLLVAPVSTKAYIR